MATYLARIAPSANKQATSTGTVYATVRAGTTASTTPGGTTIAIGQGLAGTAYTCNQLFLTVNTSSIPSGAASGYLVLNATTAGTSSATDQLEVRECSTDSNMIAGDSLAALTLLGSAALPTSVTKILIPLDFTSVTRGSNVKLVVHSQRQRTASAPATSDVGAVMASISNGTATLQPGIDVAGAWNFRANGTVVESVTGSGTLTLTEPTGAANGDLLVALITMRGTATAAGSITLPSGWTRLGESYTNNVLTTGSAVPSGTMAYIVRGSSAPSYAFDFAAGNSVIQGRVTAYNPSGNTPVLSVTGTPRTTPISTTAVSVTGLTTLADDSLIIVGALGGQEAIFSAFAAATDPTGPSGSDSTAAPVASWNRRFNNNTASGADTAIGLADAIKPVTGATGNFTCTASQAASHVVLSATFTLSAGGGISPGVTSTALAITAGTVSVTAISGVTVNVTSTALGISAGTVSAPGGGTVTGLNIHGSGAYTGTENNDPDTGLTLGVVFCAFAPITVTGVRFWKTSIDTATSREVAIYNAAGTTIASGTSSGEPTGTAQWVTVPLTTPLAMTGNGTTTSYLAAVYMAQQNYPATNSYYSSGHFSADGKAYALSDSEAISKGYGGNSNFNYVVGIAYPNGTFNQADYWQDIEYSYSTAGGLSVNVTGAGLTVSDGTVTVAAKASTIPTGDIVTTTAGTVTVTAAGGVSVNVTSTALGITAGTVTASIKASASPAGDIVTTTAGTVTVTAKQAPSVNVTGDIVTASAGTVSVAAGGSVSVGVASAALGITAGTVTVTGKANVNATGDIVTTTAGTVTASIKATGNVTSTALATTAGTVTVTNISPISVNVTSTALATTAGTVTVVGKASTTTTGQQLGITAGTVTVVNALGALVNVSGQQLATTAGTVAAGTMTSVGVVGEVVAIYAGVVAANGVTGAAVTSPGLAISRGTITVVNKTNVPVASPALAATAGTVTVKLIHGATVPVTSPGLAISNGTVSVNAVVKGGMKVWSGTRWTMVPVRVWTGSAWVQKPVKTWTGSAWVAK